VAEEEEVSRRTGGAPLRRPITRPPALRRPLRRPPPGCRLTLPPFAARRYELGRQAAATKLSSNVCVRRVRVRGGNSKFRALRVDSGNFSWGSEAVTRKTRILDVNYNASNNELVRTQTIVKNAIVQIDAAPFRQWYQQHYGSELGAKKRGGAAAAAAEGEAEKTQSNHVKRTLAKRSAGHKVDQHLEDQFSIGRVFACISSRPGQCGRADGYILEGRELEFYLKKMQKKKSKAA
jgi:small subunit ribosomal protein S8e